MNDPESDAIQPQRHPITSDVPSSYLISDDAVTMSEPRKPHPGFWESVLWCLGFLLVTQIPGAIIAAGILIGYGLLHRESLSSADSLLKSPVMSNAMAAAFFVTEILVIGVSLLVIRLMVGRDWKRQLAVRRPSAAHVVLALASLPALVLLANAAYALLKHNLPDLSKKFGGQDMMTQMMTIFAQWPWPFGVLVIGMGPGIGEELWCRGFLGRGLVGRYGVVLGVIFSSFFFGLIHVDPAQGTMAMLMGLYLHFTYLVTRSLWVPMMLHFLNNSLAVVSSRLPFLESLDADPATAPIHLFIAAAVLIGIVIWALYTSRARLAPREIGALWRPTTPGVEYPPNGSGIQVVHPAPSVWAFVLTVLALGAFVGSCYLSMNVK